MKTNFIVTEGYPKWVYINPSCRECDKRIAIGAIPNSSHPFIFIAKESESQFLKGGEIFQALLSNYGKDVPNAEPVFPVNKNRTIEDGLEVNDIIVDSCGQERKILAVLNEENKVYILSVLNTFDKAIGAYTLTELIDEGYKLKSKEYSDTVEMTVEEISKRLGKNVKIIKG